MTDIPIRLDPSSPIALYRQISEQLRRLIAIGALRPGDRLPTVRDLALQTGVNRNTAARAIQHLESEGLVSARVGRGTFVDTSASKIGRAGRERIVDQAIDRLLIESETVGMPLEMLGWRLSRRVETFRRQQQREQRGGSRGNRER